MLQDSDDRLGQLLVIVIGVDVDKVDDARARLTEAAGRARPSRWALRVNGRALRPGAKPDVARRPARRSINQRALAGTAGNWR